MNRRLLTSRSGGFAGRGFRLADAHIDKETFALCQCRPFSVKYFCFGPVFAALAANHAALHADRRAGGNRAAVVDLHLASHGGDAAGADSLAHGLVKQCGDDASVQIAGMALESAREWMQGRRPIRLRQAGTRDAGRWGWPGRSRSSGSARHEPMGSDSRWCSSSFLPYSLRQGPLHTFRRSTLPPVRTMPIRLPAQSCFSLECAGQRRPLPRLRPDCACPGSRRAWLRQSRRRRLRRCGPHFPR